MMNMSVTALIHGSQRIVTFMCFSMGVPAAVRSEMDVRLGAFRGVHTVACIPRRTCRELPVEGLTGEEAILYAYLSRAKTVSIGSARTECRPNGIQIE